MPRRWDLDKGMIHSKSPARPAVGFGTVVAENGSTPASQSTHPTGPKRPNFYSRTPSTPPKIPPEWSIRSSMVIPSTLPLRNPRPTTPWSLVGLTRAGLGEGEQLWCPRTPLLVQTEVGAIHGSQLGDPIRGAPVPLPGFSRHPPLPGLDPFRPCLSRLHSHAPSPLASTRRPSSSSARTAACTRSSQPPPGRWAPAPGAAWCPPPPPTHVPLEAAQHPPTEKRSVLQWPEQEF